MGRILEIQTFNVVFSNNVLVAMAAVAGDSLIVKNGKEGSAIRTLAMWSKTQLAVGGTVQVLSPLLHDSTRGFRARTTLNDPENLIPAGCPLRLSAQDNLTVSCQVADAAGDQEYLSMLNLYDDFENVESNLITYDELQSRMKQITTVEDTSAAPVAATYSGQRAINAGSDLLHANTEYALLGVEVGVVCQAVCVVAPDFANFRVGMPGNNNDHTLTENWFIDLAKNFNAACIPVFNSANKGNILVQIMQDENNVVVPFNLILAELSGR